MNTQLDTLLNAAQSATLLRGEGVLDAFGQVIFGPTCGLACTSGGVVLAGHIDAQLVCIDQSFHVSDLFPSFTFTLEELCANNLVSWQQISLRTQALQAFRPFGAGIKFQCMSQFNPDNFVSLIERYNCHRSIGERIATDLLQMGERTTTVQSHLVDRWDDLQQDLRAIGICIERVLPRLVAPTLEANNISTKVEALARQFKR